MKGCFACKKGGRIGYLYGGGRREAIEARIEILPGVVDEENLSARREELRACEAIFCGWDMLELTEEQVAEFFPNLRVIFYAAGSVRYFAAPFLRRGVTVLSAWQVMAEPVAQFTAALITLANKGAHLALRAYREQGYAEGKRLVEQIFPGTCDTPVGILGAGAIGCWLATRRSVVTARARDLLGRGRAAATRARIRTAALSAHQTRRSCCRYALRRDGAVSFARTVR